MDYFLKKNEYLFLRIGPWLPCRVKLLEDVSLNEAKEYHRINGPAIMGEKENGTIIKIWYYNGVDYTNEVKNWLCDNMIRYSEMTEDDFDKMWFEIL